MKKLQKKIRIFFHNLLATIDKKIILPITKLVVKATDKFQQSGKRVEGWLSRSNTILFISLFLAVAIFIAIDQKILIFTDSSAEVLKSQPVKVIYNEEAYVIEGIPETVDITLIGSRSNLYIAKQSSSHDVEIDLTGLKPGNHKVNIKYTQTSPLIDYKVNPATVNVTIYPKVSQTKTLTIDLLNQDSLDSKLVIKNVSIDSDKVVIKGAEKDLQRVATVKALVDIKNLVKQESGKTTLKDIPLRAYDEKGNVVDVEIVPGKMNAEIEITSPSKELPIKVIPVGEVSFGQAIQSIETSETKVTVYGSEEALASLKYIPVEIDVNGLKEDQKWKMEIPKPVGVKSLSVNNITINVTLDKSISKEIDGVKVTYRNLDEDYIPQAMEEGDTEITVTLKGVESVVNNIDANDIIAYLDLEDYEEGIHEVEVKVEGTDLRVQYVAKIKKVKINIIKK